MPHLPPRDCLCDDRSDAYRGGATDSVSIGVARTRRIALRAGDDSETNGMLFEVEALAVAPA
jgi:hypothetical protein